MNDFRIMKIKEDIGITNYFHFRKKLRMFNLKWPSRQWASRTYDGNTHLKWKVK